MKIRLFLLILLSAFCINSVTAQGNKKIIITGTVLNSAKEPIVNAIIMIDEVKTNSITDAKGNYKVKVKPSAEKIGIFTFGQGVAEEPINGRTRIDFNFGKSAKPQSPGQQVAEGDQGVSNGYGTVKKKDVTTDINKIDGTNKKYASYHSIADMIQREVSGVRINGSSVIIQDAKDLFGSVYALVVVDGVYMNELPEISPSIVKSIEVLKGTSAAIYGSRGYGGVIVIKTKLQND
jgi:TonB-dependent starch-binding outer membrane protein SusC